MLKSTTTRRGQKPHKPHKDFPLFKHATGRWAKKVRGQHRYFGRIADDPDGEAALLLWLEQRDDLLAGRTPRVASDGLTMRDLCNRFLTAKQNLVDTGELSPRTWADYHATCERLLTAFGKSRLVVDLAGDDFERLRASLGKTWGPVAVGNEINRIRVVFKYGHDAGLVEHAVRYGAGFKRPSKKTLRLVRHAKGEKLLEAAQLRTVVDAAPIPLKAMVLLGLNCGFGNADVGNLPLTALDLKGRWVSFPRPKTGIPRRCPLWPETAAAVKEAIEARPEPKDEKNAGLVFVTKYRLSWAKDTRDNPVAKEFVKLLKDLKLHRTGLGFYVLRHVFETIGGEAKDQVAVNAIMGHADASMAAVYREKISDDRLRAVTDHVRKWLFPPKKRKTKE
ncbi:MAG: tyrosine-type recombinase/integrase [Planctomycetia bacterium]|nr:tyrosine-type recombinase/integrase [Planctomycetia bacterium]